MACRKSRSKGSSRPKESRPRDPGLRREHPGDPVPAESRSKGPRPWDPAWVGQAMRKRGMTAIHKNYKFGKECNTTAILFFYNKIHNFWDGSVYNPDGEPLPEANAIIRDILKRQVVSESDGELVRHTAKERKQMAKPKPYKVQKQTTERNLRRRKPPADAQRASHASPALTQITVAGSESVLGDRGASIWSVPGTPASPTVGPLGNCDDNEHDEPEYDGVDEEIAPTGLAVSAADHDQDVFRRQRELRTSPPAIDHDAEGEPYEAADGGAAFTHDGAGESIHFEEPQEQPAPYEFIAMMAGDDAWMNMDMSMAGFQGTADFGVDGLSDLNLDIDMAMDMLSNAGELQGAPGSHSPKAPTASLSATSAVASAASPHEAAGGNRQTRSATTTDESAPQPAPEPDWSATANPNDETTTRASQPAPIASAQPPNPPVTTTQAPYRCTPEEVLIAMQQALVGLIAERGWNVGSYQDFGGIREPHAPVNMSIPVLA